MDDMPIMTVPGCARSTLVVYKDHCVITEVKGLAALLTGTLYRGDKEFYYQDITSIQFRLPSSFASGFMQIEYPGSHSAYDNRTSENSFSFVASQASEAEKAYKYIQKAVSEIKAAKNSGNAAPQISAADEILKYKKLLDAGIITSSEFEAKKKQLLGL